MAKIASTLIPGLLVCLGTALPSASLAQSFSFEAVNTLCRADERYRTGGANMGDCYLDHASEARAQIERTLAEEARRFDEAAAARIADGQAQWQAYIDAFCGFVTDNPGNTQAYVTGAACVLELTHERLDALQYLGFAQPRWGARPEAADR
jgi:uncharacterized protein YecT (DUF1311 family)